ncbi:hypothetical protein N7507_005305 [Penicillium longicatenatum]|nr:hypothetical protein N7507_005305 [Penicillium longicatenatum]
MRKFKFIGGTGQVLDRKPFLEIDHRRFAFLTFFFNYGTEGGIGHVGFICHKQPILEKHFRFSMTSSSVCQLRTSSTITDIYEEGDYVYSRHLDAEGKKHHVRSRFLISADGKTGFARKNFLELLGIHISFYDNIWVALYWEISLPTERTHPKFPLWKLGYTLQEVYDLFFPETSGLSVVQSVLSCVVGSVYHLTGFSALNS